MLLQKKTYSCYYYKTLSSYNQKNEELLATNIKTQTLTFVVSSLSSTDKNDYYTNNDNAYYYSYNCCYNDYPVVLVQSFPPSYICWKKYKKLISS